MPAPETIALYDRAVLWEFQGRSDSQGQPKVSDVPVELGVRWNDVEKEGVTAQGTTITLSAQVVVNRRIAPGSVLWQGKLADLPPSDEFDPLQDGYLHEVVSWNGTQDIKNRSTRHEVSLMRYRGTLPTLVS